jgi:hypothetical protein
LESLYKELQVQKGLSNERLAELKQISSLKKVTSTKDQNKYLNEEFSREANPDASASDRDAVEKLFQDRATDKNYLRRMADLFQARLAATQLHEELNKLKKDRSISDIGKKFNSLYDWKRYKGIHNQNLILTKKIHDFMGKSDMKSPISDFFNRKLTFDGLTDINLGNLCGFVSEWFNNMWAKVTSSQEIYIKLYSKDGKNIISNLFNDDFRNILFRFFNEKLFKYKDEGDFSESLYFASGADFREVFKTVIGFEITPFKNDENAKASRTGKFFNHVLLDKYKDHQRLLDLLRQLQIFSEADYKLINARPPQANFVCCSEAAPARRESCLEILNQSCFIWAIYQAMLKKIISMDESLLIDLK